MISHSAKVDSLLALDSLINPECFGIRILLTIGEKVAFEHLQFLFVLLVPIIFSGFRAYQLLHAPHRFFGFGDIRHGDIAPRLRLPVG